MITLYNVVSADGFIARPDGDENFIPDDLWPHTLEFFKKHDALVMGRKTYDAMQKYGPMLLEPFEKLPLRKVVVTRAAAFVPKQGYIVARSPQDAFSLLSGQNVLVSSGPDLNSQLIRDGQVNKVVWQRVPINIGEGMRPFEMDTKLFFGEPTIEKGPLGTKFETYPVTNAYLV